MIRTTMTAAATALLLGTPMAHAIGGSFVCENQLDMDQDEAREIAGTNNGLYQILMRYRERWDLAHRREQCEAYAEGRIYEITCLNGRRDWDAIKAMVPEEYFGMSTMELAPIFREMPGIAEEAFEVTAYCRNVGAIE